MTKEELLKRIEEDIEAQYEWSDINDREEAIENVKMCYVVEYVKSELDEEDFLALMKELGDDIKDMTELRYKREQRAKQKAFREVYKARKKAMQNKEKVVNKVFKEEK